MIWCEPTTEAIDAVEQLELPIVEIGSGDGAWLDALRSRGLHAAGYDLRFGLSHIDAARDHPDCAMLAVWPPDGDEVQHWIAAASWPAVVIVSAPLRVKMGNSLAEYRLAKRLRLPETGRKNMASNMEVYVR